MRDFVRRWRRITGFAMLALMLSLLGFWVRSCFVKDELDYPVGRNASLYVSSTPRGIVLDSVKQFVTAEDSVRWTSEKTTYPYMYAIPFLAVFSAWLLRRKRGPVMASSEEGERVIDGLDAKLNVLSSGRR